MPQAGRGHDHQFVKASDSGLIVMRKNIRGPATPSVVYSCSMVAPLVLGFALLLEPMQEPDIITDKRILSAGERVKRAGLWGGPSRLPCGPPRPTRYEFAVHTFHSLAKATAVIDASLRAGRITIPDSVRSPEMERFLRRRNTDHRRLAAWRATADDLFFLITEFEKELRVLEVDLALLYKQQADFRSFVGGRKGSRKLMRIEA
jgi:hypothetical protein